MSSLRSIVPPLLLALMLVVIPITGLAATEYGITADPSMDTPSETTTYEGTEYTVSSITPITSDEAISVQTSVPDGASYDIIFRGPENQIISSKRSAGDVSYTIDYIPEVAGTYAITIQSEGTAQTVQPVIVQGYDIAVSAPETVEQGESITIEASASERSIEKHSSFDRVEFVIGNEDIAVREQMSQADDGTYTATVSTDDLETQSYNVYAAVRGEKEVRKRDEILGVSESTSFEVTTAATETPADSNPGGSTGSEPDNSTATPTTPATTPTVTSTIEATPTLTMTPAPTATPTDNTPSTSPTTTDNSSVIEPSTATQTATTDADGPGFSALLASMAIVGAFAIFRRR
ncbi:hypothetical protein [Natronomonas gomsonensis]|uniref:hypothetical protein n=1 Tax=Natronomonas gomsonensis TaxID=1046043 RepID=UPI0015BF8214|nr:hypothetical protein [Natronomonas gomsonensis]